MLFTARTKPMETTKTRDPAMLPLPEKERYTYTDYVQLPEGAPYELIHGELLMSPSPSTVHQRILRRLARALDAFIEQDGHGEILFAPMDVRLSEEDTVQPDLIFIAADRRDLIGEQAIEGAPDLIVEILSPSTAYRDLTIKKRLYEEHGVNEYWIVDPEQQTVEVFELADGRFMQHARVVEKGTAASKRLDGFQIDLTDLFQRANA
jgi:Uma2 family endonuclease